VAVTLARPTRKTDPAPILEPSPRGNLDPFDYAAEDKLIAILQEARELPFQMLV